ncbi:MAG: HEPN domain-containing protein [Desulfurococcales archaeon]|nr:HEPN domain-containing protein [Desulfurococcales archaeon]
MGAGGLPVLLDWDEYWRWIRYAERTRQLIDADIEYGGYSWACFKSHQAAELALKALLHLVGNPRFGHDLVALLGEAVRVCGPADRSIVVCASVLNKMYIPPRYPDALPGGSPEEQYTLEEAVNAKECSTSIIEWVKSCAERLGGSGEEAQGEGTGNRASKGVR